jgi:hypothetical protein
MPISDFLRKKALDVAGVTDQPTISRTMCLKITSGNDSTTGTGEIVLDWSSISSKADIAVYDQNNNLLDYYFESFNSTDEKAVIWVYREWVQDGSTQLKVAYGNGPSDQSVSASTVFDKESNLSAGYLYNEESGDALDITSNNNDATVSGVTQGEDGIVDGAYSFDGSDDYIDYGDKAEFQFSSGQAFAFEIWVKHISGSSNGSIITKGYGDPASSGSDNTPWYLMRAADGVVNGKAEFFLRSGSSDFDAIGSTDVLDDFHHIVAVYDPSEAELRLYVDAALEDTVTGVDQDAYGDNGNAMISGPHHGDFAEFLLGLLKIYKDGYPSEDDITALYNATKSSPDFFSQQAGVVTVVSTDETTNVTSTSATLNGTLYSLEGEPSLDVWFDYSTDDTFSTYNSTSTQTLSSTGSFSDDVSDLTAFETYYVRAAATDGVDTWYGGTKSFFTTDFSYVEDEGSDFETGTLTDVEVVDDKLQLPMDQIKFDFEDELSGWTSDKMNLERSSDQSVSGSYSMFVEMTGEHCSFEKEIDSISINNGKSEANYWFRIKSEDCDDHQVGFYGNDGKSITLDFERELRSTAYYFGPFGNKDSGVALSLDTWYKFEVYFNGSDSVVKILDSSETELDSTTVDLSDITYIDKFKGEGTADGGWSYYIDDVFIFGSNISSSGTRTTDPIDLSSLESAEDSIVQWDSDEPTDTNIKVESSLSTDGGDTWNSWVEHSNGSAVSSIEGTNLASGLIKFRQTLETNDDAKTPTLSKFEFFVAEGEISEETHTIIKEQSESEDSVHVIHAIVTDSGEGTDSVYKEYVSFTLQESSTGNDYIVINDILVVEVYDSSNDAVDAVTEIESVFNLEDDSAGSDDIDSRFGVFDSSSSSEDITGVTVYSPVDDTGTVDEQLGIEVYFSIQLEHEIGDWVGYRVQLIDWMNNTEKIGVETSLITFTESLTGDDSNISISYLIQLSDEALSEEILSFLKLTTILESGLSQDDIVLNIFQNVQDSIQSAIESISGTFFAKVRQYAVGDDSEFPSNFSNFVDNVTGSDNVSISQSLTVQDEGLGTENDPKGCGTLYEDVAVAETINIASHIQVSDEVISSDDEDIKKLFTVNDDGAGNDEIDSAFCIQDACTVEESPTISSSMLLTENADASDDATQVYSGLEGDVLVKAINSEGKLRIAHIVKFFRSSLYTFKIKETAKGEDNVRKRI